MPPLFLSPWRSFCQYIHRCRGDSCWASVLVVESRGAITPWLHRYIGWNWVRWLSLPYHSLVCCWCRWSRCHQARVWCSLFFKMVWMSSVLTSGSFRHCATSQLSDSISLTLPLTSSTWLSACCWLFGLQLRPVHFLSRIIAMFCCEFEIHAASGYFGCLSCYDKSTVCEGWHLSTVM